MKAERKIWIKSGVIRKNEGYKKSAVSLELESSISCKSMDFGLLESHILSRNWHACINVLYGLDELTEEIRASALLLTCRQSLLQCLIHGDDSSALSALRKQISALPLGREKVHKLGFGLLSLKEMGLGKVDDAVIIESRKNLLNEIEKLLPPPLTLPERRLEYLLEMAVSGQIDSCIYQNSFDPVSLYDDQRCG